MADLKNRDQLSNSEDDPKGHPLLDLTFREGHYYLSNGARLDPGFKIGPEERHKNLYNEWQRSFGVGLAFDLTHSSGYFDPRVLSQYGKGFKEEYHQLTNIIRPIMAQGTVEQVEEIIKQIKDFRRKYPKLYSDVK